MKQGSIRKQALALCGGALLGAVIAVAVIRLAGDTLPAIADARLLALLPLAILLYLLCIAVHEAGHVAAGLLVGYRPLIYIAEGDAAGAEARAREARRLITRAVDRGAAQLDDAHVERILAQLGGRTAGL